MPKSDVVSIHVAAHRTGPMTALQEAHAIPGSGLEGDRYFRGDGTFSDKPSPDREVTLLEIEAIEALQRDYGVAISPGDARRNIVTRGVSLNHFVGREFRVGDVRLRGLRLCEPCAHLAKLTYQKVLPGLVHRGGLRAQVLSEGTIRVGDAVAVEE